MKTKKIFSLAFIIAMNIFMIVLTLVFFFLSKAFDEKWIVSVFVTFLTTSYHFSMRLCVGESVSLVLKIFSVRLSNYVPVSCLEMKFYGWIRVKEWKGNAITAKPEMFDVSKVSFELLLHNMIQAEIVHDIIIVLSFVPLLFIIPFGASLVFILTSCAAALVDLKYVMIQRFNRPRVERIVGSVKSKKTP